MKKLKNLCIVFVVVLLLAGCAINNNSNSMTNMVNRNTDKEVNINDNVSDSIIQAGQFAQNDINWAQPPCFILDGHVYYARFYNGYEGALIELPKNCSVHGRFDMSNFSADLQHSIELLKGLDYYFDPEDLSVVYVYQKCFLYGYREEYRYVPYNREDSLGH